MLYAAIRIPEQVQSRAQPYSLFFPEQIQFRWISLSYYYYLLEEKKKTASFQVVNSRSRALFFIRIEGLHRGYDAWIFEELKDFMKMHNFSSVEDFRGFHHSLPFRQEDAAQASASLAGDQTLEGIKDRIKIAHAETPTGT
ncbi:hypothetical protein D5086_023049 [Populus alba]|uniref:Uncharacterized protein n=1 Tax=Populus alba TaxID=43335 RepID=A0ACC4B8P6_POPAL